MNRLTAIGLASLVAYGLLITSKYTGVVSAAREGEGAKSTALGGDAGMKAVVMGVRSEPVQNPISPAMPVHRAEQMRASPASIDFRAARDLKAYADGLNARRASLNGDERYHLAKALEECQFTTSINEDIAAYSAKQRKQFLNGLQTGDANYAKRVAAYDGADTTQRCLRFQGTTISQKEIEDLYAAAAHQGDPRAQARMLIAELNAKINQNNRTPELVTSTTAAVAVDDFTRLTGLLETRDPEATMMVGGFLAQSAVATQLHIGTESAEASSILGAFSLVACDMTPDCFTLSREQQLACAFSGFCDAQTFDELYQNFLASPWSYAHAIQYRNVIHTAIDTRNWSLIGLQPKRAAATESTQ
jgi:hypothetical protein